MEPARFRPRAQLFVCTNVRAAGDPLTSACGATGPAVYVAAKHAVGNAGRVVDTWVTRTACQGHCPPRGCSVILQPGGEHWVNVVEADVPQLVARAIERADAATRER